MLANYTKQDFSGGSDVDCTSGRGLQVLGDVCIDRCLLDFFESAYNFTRGSSTFSFPVNTLDRGQLNASINYAINENFDIGVEAVNLTEEEIYQHCVADSGPLCFVGYPDRRIVFGGSYRF